VNRAKKHAHRAGIQRLGRAEPTLKSTMAPMRAASRLGMLVLTVVILWIIPTVTGAEDTVAFTIKDARITKVLRPRRRPCHQFVLDG
jgi:hypothetical protein